MRQVRWSAAWQALGRHDVLVHQNTGVPGGREDEMRPVAKALKAVREAAYQVTDCTHHRHSKTTAGRKVAVWRRSPVVSLSLVFCAVTGCGFTVNACLHPIISLSLSGLAHALSTFQATPLCSGPFCIQHTCITHSNTQAYAAPLVLSAGCAGCDWLCSETPA